MDPGEAFLTALIAGQHEEAGMDGNDDDGENDPLDDDASQFSSTSVDDLSGGVIFGNFEPCPGDDRAATDANRATENSSDFENLPNLLDRNLAASENTDDGPTNAATTPTSPTTLHHDNDDAIPKGRSLAHHHLRAGKVVFLSFDIETGGEFCDILQLSAEIARIELLPTTTAKCVVSSSSDVFGSLFPMARI